MSPRSHSLRFAPENSLVNLEFHLRQARDVITDSASTYTTTVDVNTATSSSSSSHIPSSTSSSGSPQTSTPDHVIQTNTTENGVWTTPNQTTSNSKLFSTPPPHTTTGDGITTGHIVAITITITLIVALVVVIFWVFRRQKGTPNKNATFCFQPIRKRRSSTSGSQAALDLDEDPDGLADDHHHDPESIRVETRHSLRTPSNMAAGSRRQVSLDAFTIEDLEEEDEASRGDEYYYDEVFGQSQFEDEATQNSVRQLYTTAEDLVEEELLDFDFETLGIKIEDHRNNSSEMYRFSRDV